MLKVVVASRMPVGTPLRPADIKIVNYPETFPHVVFD
jgi:hypothetical protein